MLANLPGGKRQKNSALDSYTRSIREPKAQLVDTCWSYVRAIVLVKHPCIDAASHSDASMCASLEVSHPSLFIRLGYGDRSLPTLKSAVLMCTPLLQHLAAPQSNSRPLPEPGPLVVPFLQLGSELLQLTNLPSTEKGGARVDYLLLCYPCFSQADEVLHLPTTTTSHSIFLLHSAGPRLPCCYFLFPFSILDLLMPA